MQEQIQQEKQRRFDILTKAKEQLRSFLNKEQSEGFPELDSAVFLVGITPLPDQEDSDHQRVFGLMEGTSTESVMIALQNAIEKDDRIRQIVELALARATSKSVRDITDQLMGIQSTIIVSQD